MWNVWEYWVGGGWVMWFSFYTFTPLVLQSANPNHLGPIQSWAGPDPPRLAGQGLQINSAFRKNSIYIGLEICTKIQFCPEYKINGEAGFLGHLSSGFWRTHRDRRELQKHTANMSSSGPQSVYFGLGTEHKSYPYLYFFVYII